MALDYALHVRYFSQLALYQVMIAIQMALVIASWVQFRKTEREKVDRGIKILYWTVMGTGTIILLTVEWCGVADFLYDFAGNSSIITQHIIM